MNDRMEAYLWDPRAEPDPEVLALERLLQPYGAEARRLAYRGGVALPPVRNRWKLLAGGLAAAVAILCGVFAHHYRLTWPENSPWKVASPDGTAGSLLVGERLETAWNETKKLQVARIGHIELAPNSSMTLLQSRTGRHRIDLTRGRLHAKIWAPPAQFGVAVPGAMVVDFGCEFDLSVAADGRVSVTVASGWIGYFHAGSETLVPAHYSATFNRDFVATPVRIDAPVQLRRSIDVLDTLLNAGASAASLAESDSAVVIAQLARSEDAYSLLSLLARHPQLARGPLYPRLGIALTGRPGDATHRQRWIDGDVGAREEWWDRYPQQPKHWWLNWRDAF